MLTSITLGDGSVPHDPESLTSEAQLAEQYGTDANLSARIQLHQRFSTNPNNWSRWLFDQFDLSANAAILELGCGRGDLWSENRDRIDHSWHITLTDRSPGMLDATRKRLSPAISGLRFDVVDAQEIPFDDSVFDVVIANHMLYHVPDRPRAFQQIRRVLRPSGHFYAATNGLGHLRELFALIDRHTASQAPSQRPIDFSLNDGAAQLEPWFEYVTRRDFPDALEVTEVEPLIAYITSTSAKPYLDASRRSALEYEIAEMIANEGPIRISKEGGLFICEKAL